MKAFRIFLNITWLCFGTLAAGGVLWYIVGAPPVLAPSQTFIEMFEETREDPVFLFVGDVMLGRHVETLMDRYGNDYPFELIDNLLLGEHTLVGNLEGPIVNDHIQTIDFSTNFSFDEEVTSVLKKHGFDVVMLGNNHTLDQGKDGYEETKMFLEAAGIEHVGHSVEMGEEHVLTKEVAGEEFIIASFNITFPLNDQLAAMETIEHVAAETTSPIIVNVHWGTEYELSSNSVQQEFAHQLVDAGADVIIGHHPHVVQEVELYKGVPIFYSLGNFVFDQYFSKDVQEELAVRFTAKEEEWIFTLQPMVSASSQPRLMDREEKAVFLEALTARSDVSLAEQVRDGEIRVER